MLQPFSQGFDGSGHQFVAAFVFPDSPVPPHPVPFHVMFLNQGIESLPEIHVFERPALSCPVLPLPSGQPFCDAFFHIFRVGEENHAARFLERFQRPDGGSELHAVVCCVWFGSGDFPAPPSVKKHCGPGPFSRIWHTTSIRVNSDELSFHGFPFFIQNLSFILE